MESENKKIELALQSVLSDLGINNVRISLEFPSDPSHGDLTTNVAMKAWNQYQVLSIEYKVCKNPFELAQEIVHILNTKYQIPYTDRINAIKPGFINIWFSKQYYYDTLKHIANSIDTFGNSNSLSGKKIMVEYTDPNPFKEFHIGHLYTNIIGEALSGLFEAQGATVARANYQGDVGLHVAKCLYGLQTTVPQGSSNYGLQQMEEKPLIERIKFLGEAYVVGSKAYEESPEAKSEINRINKMVYEKDPEIWDLYQEGRSWSLEYFEELYKKLGTKFDYYYFESEVGRKGLELVKQHLKDGIFEESEGAIIFNGGKYGLHTRVFINSLGLPTYEAKELALAPIKFKDYPYDDSYIVTGNEISAYFKVLMKALSLIDKTLSERTHHIGHGMVRIQGAKMSSRTGSVITAEWLLSEVKGAIKKEYPEVQAEALEQITIGSAKFALLKNSIGRNIDFNFHESVSLSGNSGPYVQYAYVRTQSILSKSSFRPRGSEAEDFSRLQEKEELEILRMLVKFPVILSSSALHQAPHIVCLYLFELSQMFNLFYQKHSVTKGQVQKERATLVYAVGGVLKRGLDVLGIPVPQKM